MSQPLVISSQPYFFYDAFTFSIISVRLYNGSMPQWLYENLHLITFLPNLTVANNFFSEKLLLLFSGKLFSL